MSEASFEELNKALLLYKGQGDESLWSLYAWAARGYVTPRQQYMKTQDDSFLTHACAHAEQVAEVYVFPDTHKVCWRCQANIPDGIKALWIMHNGGI